MVTSLAYFGCASTRTGVTSKMISSGSDFFACGYKVRMPNIQNRAGSGRSGEASRPSPRKNGHSFRHHSVDSGKQVNELSKLLSFSDDVVSHRSPQSVTYIKAKENSRSLFRPDDLDIGIGSHLRKTRGVVGRHDCRGEPKRHIPCHLQSDDNSGPPVSGQFYTTGQMKQDLSFERSSQDQVRGKEEDIFLGRVKSVPSSKSVPWREQTLKKVSSSTAKHLTGQPSSDSLDDNHRQLSYRQSRQLRHVSTDDKLERTVVLCGDSDDLPPPKNFIKELKMGAKPVHQLKGDGNTIILTNNACFNKVLQPSYPQHPSQWHDSSKAETTAAVEEDNCARGYRRWLDFPQRAKVHVLYTHCTQTCI